MANDLVVQNGQGGQMRVNLATVNYGVASTAADKYLASVGGSGEKFEKNFPGEQYSFKSGEWFIGFGEKRRAVKAGTELIVNLPNLMAAWQKWEDVVGKTNKKNEQLRVPRFTDMRFPATGEDPIERATLGDLDKSDWELDDKRQPQDPWKPVLVMPVRGTKDDTVHHVMLSTKSACIAGFNLFRDVMAEMKLHPGQLPVVKLGTKKASMDVDVPVLDKKGKETGAKKKTKFTWDVPTFEVSDWVDAIEADNPKAGGVVVTAEAEETSAKIGKVTAKTRTKKAVEQKLLAAPVKGKAKVAAKSRKQIED